MIIYSHQPWASDRKSVLCDSSACTSVCLVRRISPLFQISFTCLRWANLWCEYTWSWTDNAFWLALSCLRRDAVFLFSELFDDRDPRRCRDKANRKIIFNFLAFPSFFYHHIIWADKYEYVFICLIIRAGVRSMCLFSDGNHFLVIHCEVWQHLLRRSCCL